MNPALDTGDARLLLLGDLRPDRVERQPRDRLERLEDAHPVDGGRLEGGRCPRIQGLLQLVDRQDVAQVPLVVLEHERHALRLEPELFEVLAQVEKRLLVRFRGGHLAVGHEHDAVDALQHQPPRGVVEHLSRDRVELQAHLHPADDAHVEREQVEEQRAVGLRLEAHHLAARARGGLAVDAPEVRGLPAQTRAVVHDLGRHLHRGVVQEHHGRGGKCTAPRGGRRGRGPRTSSGLSAASARWGSGS